MKLENTKWGKQWLEALPLGNGHMGAMVYGHPVSERIELSENTFFSGKKGNNDNQKDAAKAFYRIRDLTQKKDYAQARRESEKFIGIRNEYGTNLPVVACCIHYQDRQEKEIANYNNSLCLEEGIIKTTFMHKRSGWAKSECFLSNPDKIFSYHASQEGVFGKVVIHMETYRSGDRILVCEEGISFDAYAYESMHSDGSCGVHLKGRLWIDTDGTVLNSSESITMEGGTYFTIFLKMETNFLKAFAEIPSLLIQDYFYYKKRHLQDFQKLMKRVEFQLQSDCAEDNDRIPKLFQLGRYLLLSSSRENSKLPAHLQGIWNDNVACRIGWTCDMHLDINTQMNYWPSEVANLSEVNMPLFDFIAVHLWESGKVSAQENYRLQGWITELVTNAWGFTAPYWASAIAPCPTGGIWIATHMWEHYQYSQDDNFLQNKAYPILEAATAFFADYVFYEEETGVYLSGPSISPENSFIASDGLSYQMDTGCTYEILLIRELFSIYLESSKILEKKSVLFQKVTEILPRLLPYHISADGSLAEWKEDWQEYDKQHRHTSHLLGVYPFAQITKEYTGELAKAVEKSLDKKMNPPENWEDTGWARALMILYNARFHNAEEAYRHIKSMLSNLLAPNFFILHPPTRGAASFDNVYELDGNTGLLTGICEMLMQSHLGYVELLPAIPSAWHSGCIKGLRARGNIEVDFTWENHKIKCFALLSEKQQHCEIRFEGYRNVFELSAGKRLEIKNEVCV